MVKHLILMADGEETMNHIVPLIDGQLEGKFQ